MIARILSLLTIPLMALTIWGLIRQVNREQPIGLLTPVIGLLLAPLTLAVNIIFMQAAAPGWIGVAMLLLGFGLGLAWGQSTRLMPRGGSLVARRSVLHLIFWAVSYAITQILATFAPVTWVAGGLVTMFFSTGSTLGTNLNLLVRQLRLRPTLTATPSPAFADLPIPERP